MSSSPSSDESTPEALSPGGLALDPEQRVVQSAEALTAEIDGEVVALDVVKGVCYGLDPIGSRIWAMLATPTSIARICADMATLYDVGDAVCLRDVTDLIADLVSEGLVRLAPDAPVA